MFTGMACCALFSKDGCWYRAEIIKVELVENQMIFTVVYLDYGNWERVPLDRYNMFSISDHSRYFVNTSQPTRDTP